jgi:hypothetical protein
MSLVFRIIGIMTVQYKYYICDVFTKKRFGGNPLAVLPDASGLKDKQMQQIAREFNFSESTFVFPPEKLGFSLLPQKSHLQAIQILELHLYWHHWA